MEASLGDRIRRFPGAPDPHPPRAQLGQQLGHLPRRREDVRNRAIGSQKMQIEGPAPN